MSPVRLLWRTRLWRKFQPVRDRLGRRGTVLAILGFVWVLTGLVTPIAPPPVSNLLLTWFPYLRAAGWIITGLIALVYAVRRSGDDWGGWLSLYIMAVYRVIAYGVGTLQWAFALDPETSLRSAFGALAWVSITALIMVCSGWREVPELSTATGAVPVIQVSADEYFKEMGVKHDGDA